ncbi:MAG: hypothetical protein HOP03_05455 [Lysobacter sp.]|nr:hypothetical protein [Lysobacter sp.]
MIGSFKDTQNLMVGFLEKNDLEIAPDALQPLRSIDFANMVAIYDHEELFLRETFFGFLLEAYHARLISDPVRKQVLKQDVRAAMLMLGIALPAVDEAKFSQRSKTELIRLCPYCVRNDPQSLHASSAANNGEGEA